MAHETAEIAGTSIVLLGKFDPAAAQPKTLVEKGLLRSDDLATLVMQVVLPDVVAFTVDWMSASFEPNRAMVSTNPKKPMAEPVRDFILDIVEEMSSHAVEAFGINNDYHFAAQTMEVWHEVGHALVPKDPLWTKVSKNPGLLSLSIRGERDDGHRGYVQIKVEPSLQIPNGIYVQVNDHFTRPDGSAPNDPAMPLLKVIEDEWTNCLRRADIIIQGVRALAVGEESNG